MYFPYLYGRGEELRALRAVSSELPIATTIKPVIEPVKENPRDLMACLNQLGQSGVGALVIVNPRQGDFKAVSPRGWRTALAEVFANFPEILPTLLYGANVRPRDVQGFLNSYPDGQLALVYKSSDIEDDEIQAFVRQNRIRFHVNRHDGLNADQRSYLPRTKAVDIKNRFNSLDRNADYLGKESFSDGHLTFQATSTGYGDYSVIGHAFHEGGGPAHAVAIHAVFRQPRTGKVWIEHFVSDDTDPDVGTVQEKYHQAATKLVDALRVRASEFGDNIALQGYRSDVERHHFSGLGVSKRRQIHHHIALNHRLLTRAM
jgi:hypothetical protein